MNKNYFKKITATVLTLIGLCSFLQSAAAAQTPIYLPAPSFYVGSTFSEGFAAVPRNTYYLYITSDGSDAFGGKSFGFASNFENGTAVVRNSSNLYGIIDKTGDEIVPCEYNAVGNFSEGLAAVQNSTGKWGFVDMNHNVVIPFSFDGLPLTLDGKNGFSDGLCAVTDSNDNVFYINKSGAKVGKTFAEEDRVSNHVQGLAAVRDNGSWYFMDTTGVKKSTVAYEEIFPFINKTAMVKIGGKYGFVDKNLNYVVQPTLASGSSWLSTIYSNGYYVLGNPGSFTCVNTEGDVMFTNKNFYSVSNFQNGYASYQASSGGKYGVIDAQGNILAAPLFDYISGLSDGIVAGTMGGSYGYGYYDYSGVNIYGALTFNNASAFTEGFACVNNSKFLIHPFTKPGNVPYYTIPYAYISTAYPADNKIIYDVSIRKIYPYSGNAQSIWIAAYNTNNVLLKASKYSMPDIALGSFDTATVNFDVPANYDYCKVFVFGENLEPLTLNVNPIR